MSRQPTTEPETTSLNRPVQRKGRRGKALQQVLEGEFLTRTSVIRNLPYLAFLSIIALAYIGNTFYAEKTFKEIERTRKELKELRYRYITTKSNLMYLSKQTEVARRAKDLGLELSPVPPFKIFYSRTSRQTNAKP